MARQVPGDHNFQPGLLDCTQPFVRKPCRITSYNVCYTKLLREFAIQSAAARRGLAPAVVYADPERGILLCRYVAGRTWSREDLGDPQRLDAVAALLRSVHALPLAGHVLEPAEVGRRYLQGLAGDDALYGRGAALVAWLTDIGPADNVRCCHNDVVAGT